MTDRSDLANIARCAALVADHAERLAQVEAALRALRTYFGGFPGCDEASGKVFAALDGFGPTPAPGSVPAPTAEPLKCGHVAGVGCPRCDKPATAAGQKMLMPDRGADAVEETDRTRALEDK